MGEARLAAFGCFALIVCGPYLIPRRHSHSNSCYCYVELLDFASKTIAAVEPGQNRLPAAEPWIVMEVGL